MLLTKLKKTGRMVVNTNRIQNKFNNLFYVFKKHQENFKNAYNKEKASSEGKINKSNCVTKPNISFTKSNLEGFKQLNQKWLNCNSNQNAVNTICNKWNN